MAELKDIELVKGEIQNILKRPPHIIVRIGTFIIVLILLSFLLVSYLVKYPDTITYPVKVIFNDTLALVIAEKEGRINMIKAIGDKVKKKEIIAVFNDNLHSMNEILEIESYLLKCDITDSLLFIPKPLITNRQNLGNISEPYSHFIQTANKYHNLMHLVQDTGNINEIKKINISLQESYSELLSAINKWKSDNLILSPINGFISFQEGQQSEQYIHKNQKIFEITSDQEMNSTITVLISEPETNYKIAPGQEISITIDKKTNRPENISGKIKSVFFSNTENLFIADVEYDRNQIKDTTVLSYFSKEQYGKADIKTEEKSIFNRIISILEELFKNKEE